MYTPGGVFAKGLSQVLGLTFVQKYSQLKPETWLRPFMKTAPGEPGANFTEGFRLSHVFGSSSQPYIVPAQVLLSRDGSVGLVPRYQEHFTETL